jgi:hypothetical protein
MELLIKNMKEIGVGMDRTTNQRIHEIEVTSTAIAGY